MRLRYGTLLELFRSCTATVQGISEIDDAFRYPRATKGDGSCSAPSTAGQ